MAEMLYLNCGNTQYSFSIHKVLNSLNFQQIVNLINSLIERFALHYDLFINSHSLHPTPHSFHSRAHIPPHLLSCFLDFYSILSPVDRRFIHQNLRVIS